ncbi:MAG: ROK family protein [Planctomycetes bacterium]|nr:ROK family protein [Planctomycetota bacterium]
MAESDGGRSFFAGVDLGGTNVRAGIVDEAGVLHGGIVKMATPKDAGPDAVMDVMAEIIKQAAHSVGLEGKRLSAIGIGSPGPLNSETGVIVWTPNLPGFENYPVTARVVEKTGRPTFLEGDANAACFGEYWMGAARGARSMVMFTLGTGVGGGIVLNGKILRGPHYTGGHVGHMVIDPQGPVCGCGARGCLEQYASATAVARRAAEVLQKEGRSDLNGVPLERVASRHVAEAAAAGDDAMKAVLAEAGRALGIGFVNIANVVDPEVIVVGGGLAEAGELILGPAEAFMRDRALFPPRDEIRIVPATLGDSAGIIGAAGCARNRYVTSR